MRLHLRFILLFTVLSGNSMQCLAQIPVLLRVVKAEQHDSLGCNIVSDLTGIVYKQIMQGKKFWDSPAKEVPITASTLKEIERASETSFLDQPVIYIYEFWSGNGKNLKTTTTGFGFFNKTASGEEISYGYMDSRDMDVLFASPAATNANGMLNTTIAYFLSGKNYHFHIIQYGSRVIDNVDASERIKEEVTQGSFVFPNSASAVKDIPQKLVKYEVDLDGNADSGKRMNALLLKNRIEEYFETNNEVFFNLGGDRITNHINLKSDLHVNRIEVKEVWKKIDGELSYDPVSVKIYVNDTALNEVLYRDMIKMEITVSMKSWVDFLREKSFPFTVTMINDQVIKKPEAYLYQKALYSADWKQLTEYVKRY